MTIIPQTGQPHPSDDEPARLWWDNLVDPETGLYNVQTRDGREVRIHTLNGMQPEYPVIGEYENDNGKWQVASWTIQGYFFHVFPGDVLDLVPASHTVHRWVNVYRLLTTYRFGVLHKTQLDAQNNISPTSGYVTTIHVEWEEE